MRVKLRDDPGQMGYWDGAERQRADTRMCRVRWDSGATQWKADYELIFLDED